MKATVTIVDEITRASEILLREVINGGGLPSQWDNNVVLREALECMSSALERI